MAATQSFGNMTDLEKVEKHRASFNENIAKMQEAVSKNSKFLTFDMSFPLGIEWSWVCWLTWL